MKRFLPLLIAVAGVIALLLLLPLYDAAQPAGVRVTRSEAQAAADKGARELGIPLDEAWSNLTWRTSPILEKELQRDPRRAAAFADPVFAPRLGAYRAMYYRPAVDKGVPFGRVTVGARSGQVVGARMFARPEEPGKNPTEAELRPRADAFIKSRVFRGAPSPQFEQARPTVLRGRTDWVFRYRVAQSMQIGGVVPYLNVYFIGDRFAGFELFEEYGDGRTFFGDNGGDVAMSLVQFATMMVVLLVMLIIFLRKYHAGEVGVRAGSFLFAVMVLLTVGASLAIRPAVSEGFGMGTISAEATSWVFVGFKLMFTDFPVAVLVFFAWSIGESYVRERWGEKLASFEALLRRDPMNATVGRSLLRGLLLAPGLAAATFAVAAIPLLTNLAWPSMGGGTAVVLALGGPATTLLYAASDALLISTGAILFILGWAHSRRMLWLGIIVAVILGVIAAGAQPPIEPTLWRHVLGFGGVAVAVAIFLATDLLTTAAALFGGSLLVLTLPLLRAVTGELFTDLTTVVVVPFAGLALFAIGAMLTRREVIYTYEDLAPHVKRIVERERVKAEIDAANRIQAALLPLEAPHLVGASVASHYRAATEIGGDYFDFLPQANGEIGIAFGDVSGHGLTSGIVMAMAKSALLVQIDYDSSPRAVLDVLNDIVIRTAPKRILMTFFFGLLDPQSQTLRFSSAGHLDPYVYRAARNRVESLSSWGFPLGVKRREPFREHEVAFAPGDRLILYSDGLIEAVDDDGEPFGFDRFERAILDAGHLNADEIKKSLLNAVKKFTRNRPPEDDQTLVVVSFHEVTAAVDVKPKVGLLATDVTETVH
ncbi:MAG TPA: PP2C family protein-serine/threonine phosphatase [Thermoanaerobaculia bacterium]